MEKQICTTCREEKSLKHFYFDKSRNKPRPRCKECYNRLSKESYDLKRKALKSDDKLPQYVELPDPAFLITNIQRIEDCKRVEINNKYVVYIFENVLKPYYLFEIKNKLNQKITKKDKEKLIECVQRLA